VCKFLRHFGHGDLPASQLAGLLSECGYIDDRLRATLDKAEKARTSMLADPSSIQVQAADIATATEKSAAKYETAAEKLLDHVIPKTRAALASPFAWPASLWAASSLPWVCSPSHRSHRRASATDRPFLPGWLCQSVSQSACLLMYP
jgi:hypothetical protein